MRNLILFLFFVVTIEVNARPLPTENVGHLNAIHNVLKRLGH
ncbi:MAG: hypothetical protein GAK35_00613 [Herbaspirillum frisingense]|uniref:Uncharacterized protein n=1 Tax=Herbaspirillum frisingense TaxID=92645 RepID=A0A7V8JVX3_9BURK|nr:MAG: hypothetical protein GAK35_00613 [Herbaspirillum frisingense]